jgi:integrase
MASFNLRPERSFIDAPALPDVVERYVVDARLRRLAPETVASYEYLLSLLLEWWAEAGPVLNFELDERAWHRYADWLGTRTSGQSGAPLSLSVRRKAMSVCRQLLRWCRRYGFLSEDFSHQIPRVTGEEPLRTLPTQDDLVRLLAAAGESFRPVRDQGIVAVFLGTGVRRAEAAGLDVPDVQFLADGTGQLRIRHAKLGKSRTVVFDRPCGDYLSALLDEVDRQEGPLFTEWHDRRLSAKGVAEAVKRALRVAGIDQRGRGPHELRRVFASVWARHKRGAGDGKKLSMQFGHSSSRMTDKYIYLTTDDLADGFTSPLSML